MNAVTGLEPLAVDARGVGALIGLSRATIFAMRSRGRLPAPVRPTRRAPRWLVEEIRAWLAAGCPPRDQWETAKQAAQGAER